MNIATLLKLADNPNYNMSEEDIRQLQMHQEKEYQNRKPPKKKKRTYKHDTSFNIHDPDLAEGLEERNSNDRQRSTSRG